MRLESTTIGACGSRHWSVRTAHAAGHEVHMSIEIIEHAGKRYAEIIRSDVTVDKSTFFSPADSSFQFGLLAHQAGYVEPAHYHRPFAREINDLQQMFIVQRGRVRVKLYDDD